MIPLPSIASSPKVALLLGLLLSAVFAGCMDTSDAECVEGVCTQTAKPGDVFVTNATRATADFPDCTGGVLVADVPRTNLDGHMPAGFTLGGETGATATLIIDVFDCGRTAVQGYASANLRMVATMVFARPLNESWTPQVVGHYAFEIFVNDAETAERLRSWGLPAHHADIEKSVAATGPLARSEWSIRADDRSYEFPITEVEGQGGGFSGQTALWAGIEEVARVDRNRTERTTTGGIGLEAVTMRGNAVYKSVIGTEVHVFRAQPYESLSDSWRLYPYSLFP